MSSPSQGLRALASSLETVSPTLSAGAQSALGAAVDQLHAAADAEAAAEATRLGGPQAGGVLAAFATAMVDTFFRLLGAARGAPAPAAR